MTAEVKSQNAGHWSLIGQVTPENAVALRRQGERLLKEAAPLVTVDLSAITRSTSAAISVLLCWMREAENKGKKIQFVHMPDKMFDVARVSGLDAVLPLVP